MYIIEYDIFQPNRKQALTMTNSEYWPLISTSTEQCILFKLKSGIHMWESNDLFLNLLSLNKFI